MGLVRVHLVAGSGAEIISTNNQVLCRACRSTTLVSMLRKALQRFQESITNCVDDHSLTWTSETHN